MKIVSVMTTASAGGAEFAAVELLDALAARGHETVMLSNHADIGRGTRVRVRNLDIGPKLSLRSWRGLLVGSPRLYLRLLAALRAEAPYDVLLVHYKKEQLLARWLPATLRSRLAWAEWGPVPFPLRSGLPRRLYLDAAGRTDVILAISPGTRRSLLEVGVPAERVQVVHNAMRIDDLTFSAEGRTAVRARLGIPTDAFVVGCISRFHPKKRNDVVVQAVARMSGEPHLLLAGAGETEDELRREGASLGARLHVVPTPGDDVADVLSAVDVTVFAPSPTEGEPRAVILGMLMGRPPLSTGAEGVSDMIRPEYGAIASPENSPDSLLPLLERYRDDPALRAAHGAAAAEAARSTYAAEVVAAHVEGLLGPDTRRAG